MNNEERRYLVERLRAIPHPEAEALADEMEAGERPAHRPSDPPRERLMRRAKRVLVANAIYEGALPVALVPEGDQEQVARAKGSRARSDAAAGALVGAAEDTVKRARSRRPITTKKQWQEFKELMKLRATPP